MVTTKKKGALYVDSHGRVERMVYDRKTKTYRKRARASKRR